MCECTDKQTKPQKCANLIIFYIWFPFILRNSFWGWFLDFRFISCARFFSRHGSSKCRAIQSHSAVSLVVSKKYERSELSPTRSFPNGRSFTFPNRLVPSRWTDGLHTHPLGQRPLQLGLLQLHGRRCGPGPAGTKHCSSSIIYNVPQMRSLCIFLVAHCFSQKRATILYAVLHCQ